MTVNENPVFKLFFADDAEKKPQLIATEFRLHKGHKLIKTARGNNSDGFKWSPAVRAISLIFVNFANFSRRGKFVFKGNARSSPALTLSNSLSKMAPWQRRMFGIAGKSYVIKRLFETGNREGKNISVPVTIKIQILSPKDIQVVWNDEPVVSKLVFNKLIRKIESQINGMESSEKTSAIPKRVIKLADRPVAKALGQRRSAIKKKASQVFEENEIGLSNQTQLAADKQIEFLNSEKQNPELALRDKDPEIDTGGDEVTTPVLFKQPEVEKLENPISELATSAETELAVDVPPARVTITSPPNCYPFERVLVQSSLFGKSDEPSISIFKPSFQEYAKRIVGHSVARGKAILRLQQNRHVLIKGSYGCGKSTIAFSIAVEALIRGEKAYYLNLKTVNSDRVSEKALKFIAFHFDQPTLFIVDAAHNKPLLAGLIFQAWKTGSPKSCLITLKNTGRALERSQDGTILTGLKTKALWVGITEEVVVQIVRCVCTRFQVSAPACLGDANVKKYLQSVSNLHVLTQALTQQLYACQFKTELFNELLNKRAHKFMKYTSLIPKSKRKKRQQ
jgi:hypothetical protein